MGLDLRVQLAQGLHAETESLRAYVFGPRMVDNKLLTCPLLMLARVAPGDQNLVELARASAPLEEIGARGLAIEDVVAGTQRFVFIEAARGDEVVGAGCAEEVTVIDGQAADITVRVVALAVEGG
jgi:hypothetical protein